MHSLHLPENTFDQLSGVEPDTPFGEKMTLLPYRWIPGNDQPGDFRDPSVPWQPMEAAGSLEHIGEPNTRAWYWAADTDTYSRWTGSTWELVPAEDVDGALARKAYIDMPNLRYKTFLNPRRFSLGLRITI
jgi:hypothetical protein